MSSLNKITIGERGVILMYKVKESKEIPFVEIYKIYIKVKKIPLKYIVLFVGLSLGIILFLIRIYGFNLVAISPTFLILVCVIKLNSYKRYVLKIKLKNGCSVIQSIPLKSKYKIIEDINTVRKVLLGIG